MADKITLTTFGSLQNDTSATTDLNTNSAAITTAINNTLSRDGTSPNQMSAPLDMNSQRIINLPTPTSNFDAVRFVDVTSLGTGGSITLNPLPVGGTTGQILSKNSNANFDAGWSSIVSGVNVTAGKTLSATNSLTLSGTDGTTMTFPVTSGNVMTDASNNAITNKTFNTSATGNNLQINGNTINNITGTGNNVVLQTAPTIGNPTFTGSLTATNLINNTALAQGSAATIKGNPTASTANITDFTVQGLTDIGTPSGSLDFIPIFDHVSGTIKKAQPVNIAAVNTAGVTSIAGNTGAFTLGTGLSNSSNLLLVDASYHRGFLSGFTTSGGGSQILTVNAGVACSDDFSALMKISTNYTKAVQTAWAVGSGNGSLDTGAIASTTWYHVYIIERLDTGVVDVLTSVSATSPTLPTNYTVKRRVGSFKTDGSSNIVAFLQDYDRFTWTTPVLDVNATNPGSAAVLRTLSTPLGVRVSTWFSAFVTTTTLNIVLVCTDPSTIDQAASSNTNNQLFAGTGPGNAATELYVNSNTSSQIRSRLNQSDANTVLGIQTRGWIDTRGK